MKAWLMHRDRDFDINAGLPPRADDLVEDLDLAPLFDAMSLGDKFLREVAVRAVLTSLTDAEEIAYRQEILRDSFEHPDVVREIYDLAVEAIEGEKRIHGMFFFARSPETILARSIDALEFFTGRLKVLQGIAETRGAAFCAQGFKRFFAMLRAELDDAYFETVREHLRQLRFQGGVLMSAELGLGCKADRYVLHGTFEHRRGSWLERVFGGGKPGYSFEIADRDESGLQALAELRGKGANLVANALAQSTDHILSFFALLRAELGFYVGCLSLHEIYVRKGEPTCMPVPIAAGSGDLVARGVYDASLALRLEGRTVGNDLGAAGKMLIVITGANQGGKSTFLRSLGLSFLMMQCGMFVAAQEFSASVCDGIYTHFKRPEDSTLQSGKLDEELGRMSEIADFVKPDSIVLFNESFSSTNEREGSEIARQIVQALLEVHVRVFLVTHLFDLADGLRSQGIETAIFLRAERQPDGRRTFRLLEGAPLPTSYGEDVFRRIFGSQ